METLKIFPIEHPDGTPAGHVAQRSDSKRIVLLPVDDAALGLAIKALLTQPAEEA